MKWIGQHIVDFIARFRSDVYLEGVTESAQDHVVGIDANGKLYKQDVSVGDITAVTITTDSGGGAAASDTSGSADFSILGATGVGVTNSGTTITATAVPGEIDHDSLQNFVAAEHYDWSGDISSTATIHTNNITDLHGAGVSGSANQLLTDDGDGTVTSETGLTFDGADLSLTSSTSGKPILTIENSNTDAVSPIIKLAKTATGANDDEIGRIQFEADDNADNPTVFAEIKGEIQDANNSGNSEDGQLELLIAQGASLVNVLKANSNSGLGTMLEFGDGSILSMTTFKSTVVNFESAASTAPIFTSKNITADASGPQFTFVKDRGGAAGVGSTSDGDNCGLFNFRGYDAGGGSTTYAWIEGTAVTTSSGNEAGKIEVKVTSDGSTTANNRNVITGTGHTTVDKVDVDLGYGAASVVTVPGNISIGGHSVNDIDVAGEFVDSDEHLMTSAAIDDRIAAAGGGGGGKGFLQWYYYSANLSTTNAFYIEKWNDEFGVSSSINSQITDYNDTASSHWQVIRGSRIVPYDATVTKFLVNVENSGTNEDIDVALWKATPSVTSRSSSGVSTTIDHLCTLTYDFSSYSGSGTWTKSTTSFNATSLTQGEYLFVTLKRTSGTDGSNYHVHSTVTFDY